MGYRFVLEKKKKKKEILSNILISPIDKLDEKN